MAPALSTTSPASTVSRRPSRSTSTPTALSSRSTTRVAVVSGISVRLALERAGSR